MSRQPSKILSAAENAAAKKAYEDHKAAKKSHDALIKEHLKQTKGQAIAHAAELKGLAKAQAEAFKASAKAVADADKAITVAAAAVVKLAPTPAPAAPATPAA